MTDTPLIPLVALVRHYREFNSRRVDAVLVPGRYRSQKDRVQLAESYLENPTAAVAGDGAPRRVRDQLAERRDAIAQ